LPDIPEWHITKRGQEPILSVERQDREGVGTLPLESVEYGFFAFVNSRDIKEQAKRAGLDQD
jgi:hypothetical protein